MKQSDCYTEAELLELKSIYTALHLHSSQAEHMNKRNQSQLGFSATILENTVMEWAGYYSRNCHSWSGPENRSALNGAEMEEWWNNQEALGLVPEPWGYADLVYRTRVAFNVGWAILDNDAEFFERIAIILKARKAKGSTTRLKASDLLRSQKKGRGDSPHELKYCFPVALSCVLLSRVKNNGCGINKERVTRAELLDYVQYQQKRMGLKDAPLVSENELSRWITKFGFNRFMAEQPAARKSNKTP